MDIVYKKAWVSGRVQGVSYRASTRHEALKLKVKGYAKNLSDGRVEVLMIGETKDVESLIAWLAKGPPYAQVSDVQVDDSAVKEINDFLVL